MSNYLFHSLILLGLIGTVQSVVPAGASKVIASAEAAGTLSGSVIFKKKKKKRRPIRMNADVECKKYYDKSGKKPPKSRVTIVNDNGTLKNAFVYISKGAPKGTVSSKPKLDQVGCVYHPRVMGVMVNQPIEIINSDSAMHNVHSLAKKSKNKKVNFNQAMLKGATLTKSFKQPEQMIKIKCDVHSWMATYVGVMDHPYFAVTDDTGKFAIKNLPAGKYTLTAWHEKHKKVTAEVDFKGADQTLDITYQ